MKGESFPVTLSTVWIHCTPSVRRAFAAAARRSGRVDVPLLLGTLAAVTPGEEGGDILVELADGEGLVTPGVSASGSAPEQPPTVELAPAVREALTFFRYHRIRPISPVRLAVRLLEIGTGETVQSLEASGRLKPYLQRLRAFDGSSPED